MRILGQGHNEVLLRRILDKIGDRRDRFTVRADVRFERGMVHDLI